MLSYGPPPPRRSGQGPPPPTIGGPPPPPARRRAAAPPPQSPLHGAAITDGAPPPRRSGQGPPPPTIDGPPPPPVRRRAAAPPPPQSPPHCAAITDGAPPPRPRRAKQQQDAEDSLRGMLAHADPSGRLLEEASTTEGSSRLVASSALPSDPPRLDEAHGVAASRQPKKQQAQADVHRPEAMDVIMNLLPSSAVLIIPAPQPVASSVLGKRTLSSAMGKRAMMAARKAAMRETSYDARASTASARTAADDALLAIHQISAQQFQPRAPSLAAIMSTTSSSAAAAASQTASQRHLAAMNQKDFDSLEQLRTGDPLSLGSVEEFVRTNYQMFSRFHRHELERAPDAGEQRNLPIPERLSVAYVADFLRERDPANPMERNCINGSKCVCYRTHGFIARERILPSQLARLMQPGADTISQMLPTPNLCERCYRLLVTCLARGNYIDQIATANLIYQTCTYVINEVGGYHPRVVLSPDIKAAVLVWPTVEENEFQYEKDSRSDFGPRRNLRGIRELPDKMHFRLGTA